MEYSTKTTPRFHQSFIDGIVKPLFLNSYLPPEMARPHLMKHLSFGDTLEIEVIGEHELLIGITMGEIRTVMRFVCNEDNYVKGILPE